MLIDSLTIKHDSTRFVSFVSVRVCATSALAAPPTPITLSVSHMLSMPPIIMSSVCEFFYGEGHDQGKVHVSRSVHRYHSVFSSSECDTDVRSSINDVFPFASQAECRRKYLLPYSNRLCLHVPSLHTHPSVLECDDQEECLAGEFRLVIDRARVGTRRIQGCVCVSVSVSVSVSVCLSVCATVCLRDCLRL
jgi:hypothetical protein